MHTSFFSNLYLPPFSRLLDCYEAHALVFHSITNINLSSLQVAHITFIPAAAAGPLGSTAWMWQGLFPLTTKPQPTASPMI